MKSSTRNLAIGIVIIIIIGLSGGWLVFKGQQDTNGTNTSSASTTPTPTATPTTPVTPTPTTNPTQGPVTSPTVTPTNNIKSFTITGQNYTFSTKNIAVNQGDTVKITFKSVGGTHDLVIDEFNARTNILSGGQEQTIQFVASKKGSFEYYCSVGDHKAMGMVGTLTVN